MLLTYFLSLWRHHRISKESFTLADGEVQPVNIVRNVFQTLLYEYEDAHQSTRIQMLLPIARIQSIRRSLPTTMAITLINSFVISRVDYCNSLFVDLQTYQTNRIQAVLNDSVRLIFGGSRRHHVTPILRLRAPQRIEFKVALLVYKALNNLAPDYILHIYMSVYIYIYIYI